MKFLLKHRIGLLDRPDAVLFLFILPSILISLGLGLFQELQSVHWNKNHSFGFFRFLLDSVFISLYFFVPFFIYYFSSFILDILREKIPYEKKKVIEKGKEYEVHYFPLNEMTKYYYKNKLHREEGAALLYDRGVSYNKFYLHGKEIKKDKFPAALNEYIIKNQLKDF